MKVYKSHKSVTIWWQVSVRAFDFFICYFWFKYRYLIWLFWFFFLWYFLYYFLLLLLFFLLRVRRDSLTFRNTIGWSPISNWLRWGRYGLWLDDGLGGRFVNWFSWRHQFRLCFCVLLQIDIDINIINVRFNYFNILFTK